MKNNKNNKNKELKNITPPLIFRSLVTAGMNDELREHGAHRLWVIAEFMALTMVTYADATDALKSISPYFSDPPRHGTSSDDAKSRKATEIDLGADDDGQENSGSEAAYEQVIPSSLNPRMISRMIKSNGWGSWVNSGRRIRIQNGIKHVDRERENSDSDGEVNGPYQHLSFRCGLLQIGTPQGKRKGRVRGDAIMIKGVRTDTRLVIVVYHLNLNRIFFRQERPIERVEWRRGDEMLRGHIAASKDMLTVGKWQELFQILLDQLKELLAKGAEMSATKRKILSRPAFWHVPEGSDFVNLMQELKLQYADDFPPALQKNLKKRGRTLRKMKVSGLRSKKRKVESEETESEKEEKVFMTYPGLRLDINRVESRPEKFFEYDFSGAIGIRTF